MIPDCMDAVVLTGHGDMDKLVFRSDWPVPHPGPGEVLIKVGACGLNTTDVNTRTGWYSTGVTDSSDGASHAKMAADDAAWGGAPIRFPRIQGADACGEVVAVGDGVDASIIGKRVITDNWIRDADHPEDMSRARYFGSECDGGFAEYTVIDRRNAGIVESDLSDAELATFSCSYTTAEGMLVRTGVAGDDVVLITGATGGVGSALIQLARRRGARTVALASESKHSALAKVGPDAILPRTPRDMAAALQKAIGRSTVTVICDIVGGGDWPKLIDVLAPGGRYACSGAIAGPVVSLDLRTLYLRDLTLHGSTVVPPHVFPDVIGYIERGEIRPLLAARYPLSEFHEAQKTFIEKRHVGNIAVEPPSRSR